MSIWPLWTRAPTLNSRLPRCMNAHVQCWAPLFNLFKSKVPRLPFSTFNVAELLLTHSYCAHGMLYVVGLCLKPGCTLYALLSDNGIDLGLGMLGWVDVLVLDVEHFDLPSRQATLHKGEVVPYLFSQCQTHHHSSTDHRVHSCAGSSAHAPVSGQHAACRSCCRSA